MPVRARRKPIDPEKYARLIAASLPIPPRSEAQNDRLINSCRSWMNGKTSLPRRRLSRSCLRSSLRILKTSTTRCRRFRRMKR